MGPDGRAAYSGLDMDLTGQTIRMANIGGPPYEAMYDTIKMFEEKTGAKVEIVFLGDGFEIDRYLKQTTPPKRWTLMWPGTTPPL